MIRRFQIEGELLETKMPQVRASAQSLLVNSMRDFGFVPVLDLDPVFKTSYRGSETYNYVLTVHGVFVGREAAWRVAGMLDGKLIPLSQKNK